MKRYIKKKECKCSVQTVGKVVEIKESYRQSVEMYYNPKMPGEILLEGDRALKILSLIFRILGYVCLAIAIGGVLFIKSMT